MNLKTSNKDSIKPFLKKMYIPPADSHKGMNGKGLIIGGSGLFHSASLWAAEIATHFLDMVHYSSTVENNKIFMDIKTHFRNGIVVHKKDLLHYVKEDDAILIGPGMVRDEKVRDDDEENFFEDIIRIEDESLYTYEITKFLLHNFPEKRFILDAGALQMMKPEWLLKLKQPAILTPHQGEFERLFGEDIMNLSIEEKAKKVTEYSTKFNCVILLKAVTDIISYKDESIQVEGGNQGLTKGGSGDILAGLTLSLYAKTDPVSAAVIASFIEKLAADELLQNKAYWYNMEDLIGKIPEVLSSLIDKT